MDTLTMSDKEKIKKLALVPDSIRSRFSILVDKWNFAIDHNQRLGVIDIRRMFNLAGLAGI